MYALAVPVERPSSVIKTLKLAMLVVGVTSAIKTDNGPAYVSQQFTDFCVFLADFQYDRNPLQSPGTGHSGKSKLDP